MTRTNWVGYWLLTVLVGFMLVPGLDGLVPFRSKVRDNVTDTVSTLWPATDRETNSVAFVETDAAPTSSTSPGSTTDPASASADQSVTATAAPQSATKDAQDALASVAQASAAPASVGPAPTPEFVAGVNVLWYQEKVEPAAQLAEQAGRIVSYVRELGANSIMISVPVFMDAVDGSGVDTSPATPTADELAIIVTEAQAEGLYIAIRPLIDENPFPDPDWRGTIRPADIDLWFLNYTTMLTELAETAETLQINELVLGAELSSLGSYQIQWDGLDKAARRHFTGHISYSNNWDLYTHSFDYTGVDAYFSIDLPADATVENLHVEFVRWYERFIIDKEVPAEELVMHEVGIPSISGIYHKPWLWSSTNPLSHEAQARWFAAACGAAKESGIGGVYYWKLDFHHDFTIDTTNDRSGVFVGKDSEDSIRDCFIPWQDGRRN